MSASGETPQTGTGSHRAASRGRVYQWFPGTSQVPENNAGGADSALGSRRIPPGEAEPHQSCGAPPPRGVFLDAAALPPGKECLHVRWPPPGLPKGHLNLSGSEGKAAGGMTSGLDFKEVCFLTGAGSARPPELSQGGAAPALACGLWVSLNRALSKKEPPPDPAGFLFVRRTTDAVGDGEGTALEVSGWFS